MDHIYLSELRQRVNAVLRAKQYHEVYVKRHNHTWNHLQKFMETKGITLYSRQVGNSFLDEWHQHKDYKELSKKQKDKVRHIDVLSEYLETGSMPQINCHVHRPIQFEGVLGLPFNDFIAEESQIKKSIWAIRYKNYINTLYLFLQKEGKTIGDLDTACMICFLNYLRKEKNPIGKNIIIVIRAFMRYLCSHELLSNNKSEYWMSLLKIPAVNQPKIPSVYTKEEVEDLLNAIDRGNPRGKRDYAMILLAARYGLRASDITGMRHCNLDWVHNRIIIMQQKTGKKAVFPLSEEVGNAIIDYLKYARPKIDSPFIFIMIQAPYKELKPSGICKIISNYLRVAGVDFTNRKHGAHALRHSLASNLLKSNETLPVISGILGHSTTETTMMYLRIDFEHLKQCALDVPCVPSSFYDNLYED
jgi:site-specific recombinase XerD/L-rhamnose mutarotase